MQDIIDEACEAVQAAAAGKDRATIRRMLTAEFRSRDFDLPPELMDVLVKQIATGTYVPEDAKPYLPLVRVAHTQDKVVAAMADIRVTAGGLLPATVRVVPDRSG